MVFSAIDAKTFYGAAGSTSAAVLGYIANGSRGAKRTVAAFRTYQNLMKRKAEQGAGPMKKRSRAGITKYKTRNSYKKKTKGTKRTYKKKGGKLMIVRKAGLRRLIDKQIHKDKPMGSYDKCLVSNFPQVTSSAAAPVQNVVDQLWYAGTGNDDVRLSVGDYTKVIDAVSVLFNGKAAALYTSGGDLSPGGVIIPDFSHIAVHEFTNNTTVNQMFLIYEVMTKEDTNTSVYNVWNACNNTQAGGTTRGVTYFGNRPEKYSQFRDFYKILKKKQIMVKPGQTFKYRFQASAAHLRLDDWLPVGSLAPVKFRKGFTKELLIINWNYALYGQPGTAVGYQGTSWNTIGTDNYGIGVKSTDYFRMRCPDNVSTVFNDDNVFCVFSKYPVEIAGTSTSTIAAPAYTLAQVQQ